MKTNQNFIFYFEINMGRTPKFSVSGEEMIDDLIEKNKQLTKEKKQMKREISELKFKLSKKRTQYRVDTKDLKEKIKQQAHAMNKMQKEIKDLKDRINTAVMFCDMFAEGDKMKDQVDEALKKFIS